MRALSNAGGTDFRLYTLRIKIGTSQRAPEELSHCWTHLRYLCVIYRKGGTLASPKFILGAQWLSGRVLDSRWRGRGFEPYRRHCVVSLSKNINPSLVLVQPRKTCPFKTKDCWSDVKNQFKSNKPRINFSCSAQLSVKFILLINVKMPTNVGILTSTSMINTPSVLSVLARQKKS